MSDQEDEKYEIARDKLLAIYRVPSHLIANPINDGTWTTPYAEMVDQFGMHEEARAERRRVLGTEI
jgi:hypothetical protein